MSEAYSRDKKPNECNDSTADREQRRKKFGKHLEGVSEIIEAFFRGNFRGLLLGIDVAIIVILIRSCGG